MDILKKSLPKDLRPYTLLDSEKLHESEVTALAFRGLTDVLISGSKDCHVSVELQLWYICLGLKVRLHARNK